MRYKITISYDGTNYCGWQVQKNAISIQKLIQKALETALQHPINLTGSGRTDAGVHAKGQTAHFDTEKELNEKIFHLTLNSLLPPDIRIKKIEKAAPDFHARYSARAKEYHYYLYTSKIMSPFRKLYSHHVRGTFDLEKFKAAAHFFVGTHDFTSFANVKLDAPQDSVRTITQLNLIEVDDGLKIVFIGNGFLYKMVRNITGTLLDVARGKILLEEVPAIFEAKDRRKAGKAAPANGLFLERVIYERVCLPKSK